MEVLLALLGAGSGGIFLAIGSAANARLRQSLQSPIAAATVNFIIGFMGMLLLITLGICKIPSLDRLINVPWWAFLGGLLGATFVSLSTLVVPRLGLTTSILIITCSQMLTSMLIDKQGWFGVVPHAVKSSRLVAIVLLLVAVALTQWDSLPSQSSNRPKVIHNAD